MAKKRHSFRFQSLLGGVFFKNPLVLLGEGPFMAKFLIHTTSVQIAYFSYFLVRVRDRSFFIMQGAAGGIWGVGGMRKKNCNNGIHEIVLR